MDVRGRRLRKRSDEITAFTSSMTFDGRIARQVVKVNMAHMISLVEGGEVKPKTGARILSFLESADSTADPGSAAEDYHQVLEQKAVDKLGVEVAGFMNLGKSRNDQVATSIRMEVRESLLQLVEAALRLQESLLKLASSHGEMLIPGYTHLQRAQPVTLGHHLIAQFDSLQRDIDRFREGYERVNLSPMGSAALGGTNVKVDRRRVSSLLGFEAPLANAMDAVSSRDFIVEALSGAVMVMLDLSRMAEELVVWSSKEFSFVELADEYAASSSIMPQKKNPVVAETVRAKCGSVLGSLVSVCALLKSLPYSYNLDLQEATPHLWRGLDDTQSSLTMMAGMISTLKFDESRISESMKDDYSTATALANMLVERDGISFRTSHAIVGELVRASAEQGEPFEVTVVRDLPRVSSRLGKRIAIDAPTARVVLDPRHYLEGVTTEGGSNPGFISKELKARATMTAKTLKGVKTARSSLARSEESLRKASESIQRGVST